MYDVETVPLQNGLGTLNSLPGILTTLLVLAVVIFVARVLLSIAWRVVIVAVAVVAILWVLGFLGSLSPLLLV